MDNNINLEYPVETNPLLEYEFVENIGRGSNALVYLYRAKQTNQEYCVKHMVLDPTSRQSQYVNEIDILSFFKGHPFIVTLHKHFFYRGNLFLLLEYSKEGDLQEYLKKYEDYLTEKQVLRWFIQICLALHSLHNAGFVHRDIKLKNILLMNNNVLNLTDFGTSIALSTKSEILNFTGTPAYTSPEMYSGRKHNFKTDIWSLGVVLYELITKEQCFSRYSERLKQLVQSILTNAKDRPTTASILKMDIIRDYLDNDDLELREIVNKYLIEKSVISLEVTQQLLLKGLDDLKNIDNDDDDDSINKQITTNIKRLKDGSIDLDSIPMYSNTIDDNDEKQIEIIDERIRRIKNIKMVELDTDDMFVRKIGIDITSCCPNSNAFELEIFRSRLEQVEKASPLILEKYKNHGIHKMIQMKLCELLWENKPDEEYVDIQPYYLNKYSNDL
ncbi:hypothetical protein PPL_10825 [Heterostelium album PN500]|uniref:non-specific serine/threonine protein kinase n=1 Tax=Heterostelium pallidum (strain ATCC 26659 / Pp 5 / PN500) TaxID=670386 RepID=D3BS33_HETP5|nr:hypothetical protein PPL_10825 [Heterostelium album PN500]EFA75770.1 hypothetical protein PPL_10825 [Heterostelium album PN500]|eukprot:XP_020427904.1 hypothetical protein PPL_10825 [Heterostelium album PN500]